MFSIIFFGSFQDHSLTTLRLLLAHPDFTITAVVTAPPRPGNRGQIQLTPVHQYCLDQKIPVYPLEKLDQIPPDLSPPDFIIVAGFGKLLPQNWLSFPRLAAINAHQSLLPDYAGRFPAEWAILRGETTTGVTLIKMSPEFDCGPVLAQESIPILPTDTRDSLYDKLYQLNAKLIIDTLPKINQITPIPQTAKGFYARQLTRQDGFIKWQDFTDPKFLPKLNTLLRALNPWPGVWTLTPGNKRLKILSLSPLTVQPEGKTPVLWQQIKNNLA